MTETTGCPDDELLIAYLSGDITIADLASLETHLGACDGCIETVRVLHTRLHAAGESLQSPPAEVRARALAASSDGSGKTQRRPVPVLLRLPILVPLSMAAGALLVVATHTWFEPPPQRVLNRAVQIQRAAHTAPVHAQPSAQAPVVGSLTAGELVEVHGMQAGWYRVALADGNEGWIQAEAFE